MMHVLVAMGAGIASGLYIFGPYFKSQAAMQNTTAMDHTSTTAKTTKHDTSDANDRNSDR